MKFKIYASLSIESLEPWIWTNYENSKVKGFILVKNTANRKKIKCYKRIIDQNFIRQYNVPESGRYSIDTEHENVLVINEYYRNKLDIETQKEYELEIKKTTYLNHLFLNWRHPNPQVQYANRITFFSISITLILGLLSLILTICK